MIDKLNFERSKNFLLVDSLKTRLVSNKFNKPSPQIFFMITIYLQISFHVRRLILHGFDPSIDFGSVGKSVEK